MKSTVKCKYEEIVKWGQENLPKLRKAVEATMKQFHPKFPLEIKVENEGCEDLTLEVVGTGYTIDLVTDTRETIARTVEYPCWQLTQWVQDPPSYWHPPDVWDKPISTHVNHWDAAAALAKALFIDDVHGWTANQGMSEELEEDWP